MLALVVEDKRVLSSSKVVRASVVAEVRICLERDAAATADVCTRLLALLLSGKVSIRGIRRLSFARPVQKFELESQFEKEGPALIDCEPIASTAISTCSPKRYKSYEQSLISSIEHVPPSGGSHPRVPADSASFDCLCKGTRQEARR